MQNVHGSIPVSALPILILKPNSIQPGKIFCKSRTMCKMGKELYRDVEFYAEDAGRTENEYLARVVEAVITAGATTVNIPDTQVIACRTNMAKR